MGWFGHREERAEKTRRYQQGLWDSNINDHIERMSKKRKPLNDRLSRGNSVWPQEILEYVAALERRVERLENEAKRNS